MNSSLRIQQQLYMVIFRCILQVDMRLKLDSADWLPDDMKEALREKVSRLIQKIKHSRLARIASKQ